MGEGLGAVLVELDLKGGKGGRDGLKPVHDSLAELRKRFGAPLRIEKGILGFGFQRGEFVFKDGGFTGVVDAKDFGD